MQAALLVLEVILGIIVVVSVLMQPSKSDALSGLIQGSNNDTFFSRNKSRTKEVMLERVTIISMLLFAINTVILNMI